MKYLTETFEKFASGYPFDSGEKTRDDKPIMLHPPATDMEPDVKPLADGSIIFQARFLDWGDDEDSYRNFMLMLESRIYTLGLSGTIRVSIAQQWDPRDLSIPYSIDESKGLITISETDLEYYKGMATVRQNVSLDIGASFSTARDNLYYKMRDDYLDGKEPKAIIVNIVWGESVIRMSRKAIRL
ncbi:MAG: hypothetical protein BV456_13560 [Thermoplasmata archaeon M8B2D]|nr:MAG: hypothetical protein BV456_13560 [Thermoplasmata archaeon M8B2D]